MTQLEQNFLEAATRFCRDHNVRNDNNIKEIDWEQRRYEIAKDAMCAVIQKQSTRDAAVSNNISFEKYSAMTAIYCADALIEELKKQDMTTQIDNKYKSPTPYEVHEWQEGYGIWEGGLERGAQWMLERATAWLAEQGSKDNDGVVMICVDDFVKAMEEE